MQPGAWSAVTRIFPGTVSVLVLGLIVAIDAAWLTFGIVSVTVQPKWLLAAILVPPALSVLFRRLAAGGGAPAALAQRLDLAMQGLAFIGVAWIGSVVLNRLLMTLPFPYKDATLAGWGAMLGVDWLGYYRFVTDNPLPGAVLGIAYAGFVPATLAAFLVMVLCEGDRRAAYLVETYFIASVVCIACGMFFPAEGATPYFLRGMVSEEALRRLPGAYHLTALYQLREAGLLVLDPLQLYGMVSLPSFHTAGVIVVSVAFWRTRWFWPAAIYSAVLIAATPVFGGHYVIDLVGGALVAALVLGSFACLPRYRGVLRDRARPRLIPASGPHRRPPAAW